MATFRLRSGVVLSDCVLEYPPTGDTVYDVKDALAAGGGSIVTNNEGLAHALRVLRTGDGVNGLVPSRSLLPSRTLLPSSGGGPLLEES